MAAPAGAAQGMPAGPPRAGRPRAGAKVEPPAAPAHKPASAPGWELDQDEAPVFADLLAAADGASAHNLGPLPEGPGLEDDGVGLEPPPRPKQPL
jgi:hypothetical protein